MDGVGDAQAGGPTLTFPVSFCVSSAAGLYENRPAPVGYYVWPPFAMYRAIAVCNIHAYTVALPVRSLARAHALKPVLTCWVRTLDRPQSYTMAMLVPGDQVCDAIIAMAIAIGVFRILAAYVVVTRV